MVFVLCNHEKGSIFKALKECLRSNSLEIAKSSLVVATWLIYMLYNLPDTGVRTVAFKSFLELFVNVLQSSKNLEEKILATLALNCFLDDPGNTGDGELLDLSICMVVNSKFQILRCITRSGDIC